MEQLINQMALWELLLAAGLIFCVLEIFVPGFVLFPTGMAFLLSSGVSVLNDQPVVVFLSFVVFEFLALTITRRYFKRLMDKPKILTNADGMIGQDALVTEAIPLGGVGYVKLYGDLWAARTFAAKEIPSGSKVTIVKLDGNKVWVEPVY